MKLNSQLISMLDHDHGMAWFMLVLFKMVEDRARHKPDFVAVECGVDYGNSTVAIQAALEGLGHGWLYSCDIVDCSHPETVRKAGLGHRWTFTQCDSVTFAGQFKNNSVDFVFIDTSHEAEDTRKEIAAWTRCLIPGGRITFHDTHSREEGVNVPIQEFRRRHPKWPYYEIDVCCGLGVLDKPL